MPNYVFLILRNIHLSIFQVLKTSFKQKEHRITFPQISVKDLNS